MNKPYTVKLTPELIAQIKQLATLEQKQLVELLHNLSVNPHPMQAYKIHGMQGLYRILFQAKYLVYRVEEKSSEVLLFSITKPE